MTNETTEKVRGVFEKVPGSNVWWIQYYDSAGRRRREKIGRKSTAIKLVEKRRSDAREGVKMPENLRAKPVTFGELAESALASKHVAKKRSCGHDILRMPRLVERFGDRSAEDITPGEIREWLDSRLEWSEPTRNRYLALMKLTYRLAETNGKIKSNPARLVRQSKEDNGRIRYLSGLEEARLREVIARFYAGFLPEFELALNTGMRMSEQFSLDWEDVNLEDGTIHLSETKNGTTRDVLLNPRALAVMRMLHDASLGTGSVFPSKKPYWFKSATEKAGIKNFTWHCLRHTFASRLVMAGVDLKTVQELMGHKSITMTARYAHVDSKHCIAALEKLCQASATRTATREQSGEQHTTGMVQ